MQIKHQGLAQLLQKKIAPLYVLVGQDAYMLEESLRAIKSVVKTNADCDEELFNVQTADDWNQAIAAANSYSLFADSVLVNVCYDKKSIDLAGKKIIAAYLDSVNTRCCMIIRAPNVPAKQISWLTAHEQAVVIIAYPLNAEAMKSWIAAKLKSYSFTFAPQIPDLIHHYTQGNMLACAQAIEKMSLSNSLNSTLTAEQAMEHLSDQCENSLYELTDACLLGQADKAIQILRQASSNKSEATLVLWMLTQEVRVLLQLLHLTKKQGLDIRTASTQLKIWPQRLNLYQVSLRKANGEVLNQLLRYCQALDEQIKSSMNAYVWNSFENLAMSLCLGQLTGDACTA